MILGMFVVLFMNEFWTLKSPFEGKNHKEKVRIILMVVIKINHYYSKNWNKVINYIFNVILRKRFSKQLCNCCKNVMKWKIILFLL